MLSLTLLLAALFAEPSRAENPYLVRLWSGEVLTVQLYADAGNGTLMAGKKYRVQFHDSRFCTWGPSSLEWPRECSTFACVDYLLTVLPHGISLWGAWYDVADDGTIAYAPHGRPAGRILDRSGSE